MNKYDLIFEAVQESLNNGEITLEEAEALNNYAYDRYITEDGHSKKLKARHDAKKRNIEKRFYDNMNFKYDRTDYKGNKHGTVQRGDGPETPLVIYKKKLELGTGMVHAPKADGSYSSNIEISRNDVRRKGSDLAGAHEYSHVIDCSKSKVKNIGKLNKLNSERSDALADPNMKTSKLKKKIKRIDDKITRLGDTNLARHLKDIDKETGFDKLSKEARRKFKSHDIHDRQSDEMRADYYALSTTKGENNSNRLKKYLNETDRRENQNLNDKLNSSIHQLDGISTELSKKKDLKSKMLHKLVSSASKISSYSKNNITKKSSKTNETRKNVNDYILKKKQEEKNKGD